MWKRFGEILPEDACAAMVADARAAGLDAFENRHFVAGGKAFFRSARGLAHLAGVLRQVRAATDLLDRFERPVVQHAFMLVKSARGPATPLHQDRAFWTKIERAEPATMLTLWFALEAIGPDRGALRMTAAGETDDTTRLNTAPRVYGHRKVDFEGPSNFSYVIEDPAFDETRAGLVSAPVGAGGLIVFDAYEPHGSTAHDGGAARMAFKIVLGERRALGRYTHTADDLLAPPLRPRLLQAKQRLNEAFG